LDLALLASALRTAPYIDAVRTWTSPYVHLHQCTSMYSAVKPVYTAYGDAFCTHARGSMATYVSVCPRTAMYGAVIAVPWRRT